MAERIAATAAVIEDDGLVLAARRAGGHLDGHWEFPGGKIEAGESPEACLARELQEEFGITVDVGQFIAENVHDYGEKVVHLMAYSVRHLAGDFRLTDHDQICWLPRAELHSIKWAPADVPLVEAVVAGAATGDASE